MGIFNMSNELLWYKKPAESFDEALPLGNGRIGAMVYGRMGEDIIGMNEDSVWSGGMRNRNSKSSLSALPKVRELLSEGHISEAEELAMSAMSGVTPNCRHYMPLCDIKLSFEGGKEPVPSDYKRELSLSDAVSTVSYTKGGVKYRRELFVSNPDNVMVCRFTADTPGSISFKVCLDGRDDYYDDNGPMDSSTIFMNGGSGGKDALLFAAALRVIGRGGSISPLGMYIAADKCDEVTLLFSARSSYYTDNYMMQAVKDLDAASQKSYDELLEVHISDYQALYYRSELYLGSPAPDIPTDEALKALLGDPSAPFAALAELYFNYGKYLMISGSRIGTLPLNLQGIWNKDMWPAWGGRFTININTEMNYWPAEVCNLSECHLPLFDLIEKMRAPGRITASAMYDCRGFVAHHNTDLWGDCAPQDLWVPATIWPMGAAWLCLHIFEHYRFTLDKDFLAEKYDTLREAALFFTDYLFENRDGYLVTGPSVSPENTYRLENGEQGSICIGPTMDSEIIYELFSDVIEASRILEVDSEFASELKEMRKKLPPLKVGKYGQICEWAVDYDEVEPGHRHVSQLFSLYPGNQISPVRTPELAAAARATLERRLANGGGHTGWSRAWMINFWARLLDGEKAGENIRLLLSRSTNPNMLDSHPPFQIDGNFGGTAGIAECILQSQNDEIYLLPALPPEWKSGHASGLMARGGFEVSLSWDDGQITGGEILSLAGTTCTVRSAMPVVISCEGTMVPVTQSGECYTFYTRPGMVYYITHYI